MNTMGEFRVAYFRVQYLLGNIMRYLLIGKVTNIWIGCPVLKKTNNKYM